MYTITREMVRPDPRLIEGFRKVAVANAGDAMGRFHIMRREMKPLSPRFTLCGPALTVDTYMGSNLPIHVGMRLAEPGDVLVVSTGNAADGGYWGELMSIAALYQGLEGLVIEGGVRDSACIAESGFPVFSTAICPRGTFKGNQGSVNVPIACGGLSVQPGDIVLGDSDGVAVIPLEMAEDVLIAAEKIVSNEAVAKQRLAAGEYLFEILGLDKLIDIQDQIK